MPKSIAVLTSGGDAPGMNAAVRAVVRTALNKGVLTAATDIEIPEYDSTYSFEKITKAINLVLKGAKLIGTNPDISGPFEGGLYPATGALISPVSRAFAACRYASSAPSPCSKKVLVFTFKEESAFCSTSKVTPSITCS